MIGISILLIIVVCIFVLLSTYCAILDKKFDLQRLEINNLKQDLEQIKDKLRICLIKNVSKNEKIN